ncbi:hypothetical protein ACJIZ3_012283 [Penstemon smallii]|uniref:Pentatricopeptide repeat-containing protein n=1 Tax=Penstemon smallii TaxID=265156 RepID=A0ABD3ULJ1_9LAMI
MISRRIQTLFRQSKTSTEILQLHCYLLKTSLDHHEYFFSQFILSASSASLHHALKLFDKSPITPPPLFSWNTLIRAYSNSSSTPLESVKIFVQLLRTPGELKADKFTYPFVIKACGRCLMLSVGASVHSMVLKEGFRSDSHVSNTLLTMYGGCGVIEFARKVFDEMCDRDVVSWSSMIAAYVDLYALFVVGQVVVVCDPQRRNSSSNPTGDTTLGRTYTQSTLRNLDVDALRVFNDMKMVNQKPNVVTLVSLLAACTNLLNIKLGKSIHSQILINGVELHVGLGTALLRMYAKSGHLKESFHIFNSINEKNLQSWTVMISCLADYGHGEEAISLFTKMKESGLRPDSMSFSVVLSACSHKGLVLEGQELFDKMVNIYEIMPTMEHYGCMVDLFGRAGKIEEAYQIIMMMPMEPNSVILRSYLSACKNHGRVLFADKHLMQLLLKIEPGIGANYVLCSMRNDMKVKGLKKTPGYSWVLPHGVVI